MPNLAINKVDCCGCKACECICPRDAIHSQADEEGFSYPVVDESRCVDCGSCEQVCPMYTEKKKQNTPEVYAVKNKDHCILSQSSSGGAFSALAEMTFAQNGVVYAVRYNDEIKAVFARATHMEELDSMRGSKYVQADPMNVYRDVMNDIRAGMYIMFIGTPCQVEAMRKYAKEKYDNLFLVDFICHGVASPRLFDEYLRYVEKKRQKRIVKYQNRSKDYGWQHKEKAYFADGSTDCESMLSQGWRNIFHTNNALRLSCYQCPFNHYKTRQCDIAIADYWGAKESGIQIDEQDGISMVAVYTEKGARIFKKCEALLQTEKSLISKCNHERQPHFFGKSTTATHRERFWRDYYEGGISRCLRRYGKCDMQQQIKYVIKKLIGKKQ